MKIVKITLGYEILYNKVNNRKEIVFALDNHRKISPKRCIAVSNDTTSKFAGKRDFTEK